MAGRQGFTLLELLTTIAALVIVLGLMAILARYVRARSAEQETQQLLAALEQHVVAYWRQHPELAQVPPLMRQTGDSEAMLQESALTNSRTFVRAWVSSAGEDVFARQPVSRYDRSTLRDAWGTPIVFMGPRAANPGLAPQDRAFFVSAGPDRQFWTIADNLYSYDWENRRPPKAGQSE